MSDVFVGMIKKRLKRYLSNPQGLNLEAISIGIEDALLHLQIYDTKYDELAKRYWGYTESLEKDKAKLTSEYNAIDDKIKENNVKIVEAILKL